MTGKLERAGKRKPDRKTDLKGTVTVSVWLRNGSTNVRGNISRGLSIKDQRVSTIFQKIQDYLLPEG